MAERNQFEQALALGYGGQQRQALECLDALLRDPLENEDRGWAVLYKSIFLAQLERVDDAREQLRELRNIWEDTPKHRARIAVLDSDLDEANGNASRTLKKLNRIFSKFRDVLAEEDMRDLYVEIQFSRGRLEAIIGDWRRALPVLEECKTFERIKSAEFFYHLGYCYFEAGDLGESREMLESALESDLQPVYAAAAHFYLGRLFNKQRAVPKAIKEFEKALECGATVKIQRSAIYESLAQSYEYLGLTDEARRYRNLADSKG